MTTEDLLARIIAALDTDPAIGAFCAEYYAKALTVQFGIDEDNPPPSESYPLAAVILASHARETGSRRQTWHMVIGLCLRDEATVTLADREVPAGALRVERLRELAEAALMAPGFGKVETDGSVEREVLHPLYAAATVITFTF